METKKCEPISTLSKRSESFSLLKVFRPTPTKGQRTGTSVLQGYCPQLDVGQRVLLAQGYRQVWLIASPCISGTGFKDPTQVTGGC